MSKCTCSTERRPEPPSATWRWGGCSDNVKHGKRVARNFLELNPSDDEDPDLERDLLRHDSEVREDLYIKALHTCVMFE